MMDEGAHAQLVGRQFGPQAQSYLTSAVHAGGEDLAALAALAPAGGRALDIGCGAGHVSFALSPRVRDVVAYDLSPDMLSVVAAAAAQRGLANVETRRGTVESLPFEAGGFDCVMTRYSAHHWRDLDIALRECARVLAAGGVLGVVDAVSSGDPLFDTWLQTLEVLRDPSHVRDRSVDEWAAVAARAGFRVEGMRMFSVRLDFASWIARMNTPDVLAQAIRELQRRASSPVLDRFRVESDGSFWIDVALLHFVKIGL